MTKIFEREILDKLRSIENRLEKLEDNQKKRGLRWKAAIPPLQLCKDIVSAYDSKLFNTFEYEMQRLAEFYGIRPMENYVNPLKVPKSNIAAYHPNERTAYYKEPVASLHTLLHEFFHHLHTEGVVYLYSSEKEEECANSFAVIIIARAKEGAS